MSHSQIDVLALGGALVDVLAQVPESFVDGEVVKYGTNKGAMTLIGDDHANDLYARMPSTIETSGGSAGNTVAGIASFGGRAAFIGKTANDKLGDVFAREMQSMGVTFNTKPMTGGANTSRCLILVTPDGQRTMNTYLGASAMVFPEDIDTDLVSSASISYLEGYMFDTPESKEAFDLVAKTAHAAGRKVSLTLSDPFCVDRHRADFLNFVRNNTDILFANEVEIASLYQTSSFDDAVAQVRKDCELAALTRGPNGAVIVTPDRIVEIKAAPVSNVIDTTGAGDQFAAGLLYGLSQGLSLEKCGELAALAAAEVISHIGPRPSISYSDFLRKAA